MDMARQNRPGASSSPAHSMSHSRSEPDDPSRSDETTTEGDRRTSDVDLEEKSAAPSDDGTSDSAESLEQIAPAREQGPENRPRITRSISISEVRDGIESRRDVEIGQPLEKEPTPRRLADPDIVTFDVDDPHNPKEWSFGRKWAAVAVISLFTFISPVSSTMTAPALNSIGKELNITSEFEKQLSLSIFVLGETPFGAAPYITID